MLKAVECLPVRDVPLFYDIFAHLRDIQTTKLLQAKALDYLGHHLIIGHDYCHIFYNMANYVLNTLAFEISTKRRGDGKKKSTEIYLELENSGILAGERHMRALLPNITTVCNTDATLIQEGASDANATLTTQKTRNMQEIEECISVYIRKTGWIGIANGNRDAINKLRQHRYDSSTGKEVK
jgi:hypothetical protein